MNGGSEVEAASVGAVLPLFLEDHFQPGDVLNRLISELLQPNHAHAASALAFLPALFPDGPVLIARVLLRSVKRLFGGLWSREAAAVAGDWVLASLPSIAPSPLLPAFLAAAAPPLHPLSALFPLLLPRLHSRLPLDADLLCLIVANFKSLVDPSAMFESWNMDGELICQLAEEQAEAMQATLRKVGRVPED